MTAMARVEFYVLAGDQPVERLKTACQLAAKGWRAGLPVFLRASNTAQCVALQELLWCFRGEAFIPHDLHDQDPQAPVVIGSDQPPARPDGLLLNLGGDLSKHLPYFSRIIEIVDQQPEVLTASRKNFRSYRQRGYDPQRVEL